MTRSDFIEIEISISISVNMTRMSGLETQQKRTTTITILPILGCRKKLNVGQRDCPELLPQRICFDCRIFGERYFVSRTRKISPQESRKIISQVTQILSLCELFGTEVCAIFGIMARCFNRAPWTKSHRCRDRYKRGEMP